MDIIAAVIPAVGADFALETVQLSLPAAHEVVVEIAGMGLCHTDLAVRDGHLPFPFPGVLGHEGSGTVTRVGDAVTRVAPGDRVVLTFSSCGSCSSCTANAPAYCYDFGLHNFAGTRPDGTASLTRDGEPLGSSFFGQSSFATHAISHERNVIKVPDDLPLTLLGPLACGVQTGAGAVLNSLDCQPGSSLLVTGGGSVGLSAVMAASARELETIIVVETQAARRDLALKVGATHVIDPADGPLTEQIRSIAPQGVSYALDTTALVAVISDIVMTMAPGGAIGLVGVPADPAAVLPVPVLAMLGLGLRIQGITEGDSDPDRFIPELLDMYRAGTLPFDALVTTVPFDQINEAVARQHSGDIVKIVLTH